MKSRQLFFATGVLLGALAIGLTAVRFADESKALIEPLKASTLSLNNGWDFEIRNENESSTAVDLAKAGCVTTRSDGTTCNSWVTDGAAHLVVHGEHNLLAVESCGGEHTEGVAGQARARW